MDAEHAGAETHRRCDRLARPAHLLGVSLIRVGSKPVVPKRRCAAAIAAMPSGVGRSLNSTSPPPLTCVSMNPGASHAPGGIARSGMPGGRSRRGTRRGDIGALDHDGAVPVQRGAVEHDIGGDGVALAAAHRVRVTFCRWRGRSGSMPSRAASLTIIA